MPVKTPDVMSVGSTPAHGPNFCTSIFFSVNLILVMSIKMALVSNAGPLVEPVLLDDVKAHLRVSESDEDVLITSLITAARVHVEHLLMRKMINQSWSYFLDQWPDNDTICLPLNPVSSVNEIEVYDGENNSAAVASTQYYVDVESDPGRIVWLGAQGKPKPERVANGIEVKFTAGYGDNPEDVPAPLRQAITLLVTHWYERREPVEVGEQPAQVPMMITTLINPYRCLRIGA